MSDSDEDVLDFVREYEEALCYVDTPDCVSESVDLPKKVLEEHVFPGAKIALEHLVRAPRAKSRVLEMQLSAHAPAFTADLPAFNGCPGLQPTRCRCALVRVIAAAHLLYANHISTDDHGSCGVRAPVELIL